jgi:hypothetical protein
MTRRNFFRVIPFFFARKDFTLGRGNLVANSDVQSKEQGVPSALRPSIEPIDYGTTAQLFDETCNFLRQHPGLTMNSALKLTFFFIAIHFSEYADCWPLVSVVAPDPTGSSLLLRMLACLCVSTLRIGEVSLNALLSLPPSQRPTLLIIDQLTSNKSLERALRIMSRPDSHFLHKGKLHDLSLPTLVCTAEPLRDRWILNQAIQVFLTANRSGKVDSQSLSESAQQLQGKLYRYREINYTKVRDALFDVPEFASPMREIASWLGRCIVDDPELQRRLLIVFKPQDGDIRLRLTDSIEAVVIEAVLFLSHEVNRTQARVGEITTVANAILKGRGEILELDPRAVGDYLRALGLYSQRLGAAGRGIRFSNEIQQEIHEQAQTFGVRSFKTSCALCANTRLRVDKPPDRES